MIENRTILIGDVLEKLKEIPDESIDVEVSSPPYWGLRDYGVDGQWGLEPDFRDYLKKMEKLMDELKRVLKKTGTCWINLGDTYSGGNAHSDWNGADEKFDQKRQEYGKFKSIAKNHIESKSRYGIPERFYVQCIDNGWLARNHIPWVKSNPMPNSVKDRFTNSWESIFFFAKSKKYYFNLDNVREPTITDSKPFNLRVREAKKGAGQLKLGDDPRAWTMSEEEDRTYNEKGERKELNVPGQTPHGIHRRRAEGLPDWEGYSEKKQDNTLKADGRPDPTKKGFNDRWNERKWGPEMGTIASKQPECFDADGNCLNNPNGKNPGDVFYINSRPFPEAHFATFPIELPLKILKCSCPPSGIVLDPFFGAGTVGVAAEMLGLNWIGIELKEDYTKIARNRLEPFMNQRLIV